MSSFLFTNGAVLTMKSPGDIHSACAVTGDRILAVGRYEEIKDRLGPEALEIDLGGGALLPGFQDCHLHFILSAYFKFNLDLAGIGALDHLLSVIKERAMSSPPGRWILGLRFREDDYPEKRMPFLDELDQAAPDHPVLLVRYDGHSILANSRALSAAGLNSEAADPAGGSIGRSGGKLTGLFKEKAMDLILSAMPYPELDEFRRGHQAFTRTLLSYGVTGVHNVLMTSDKGPSGALGPFEIPVFKLLEPEFPFRHYPLVAAATTKECIRVLEESFGARKEDGRWLGGAMKLFADGTFGSRTAFFYDDYHDAPGQRGYLINPLEWLKETIFEAQAEGLQTCTHAIGDRAVGELAEIFEQARARYGRRDLRHRLEHAGLIRPEDLRRLKAAGVICSLQPTFILSEGPWMTDRVGTRLSRVYPLRSLLDGGVPVCGGSDSPIEEPSVTAGLWAAVARPGFTPDQAISPWEAISLYTSRAAYASFEEGRLGVVAPGRLADLTVLDRNPLAIQVQELREIKVKLTMIAGRIVYQA
ncbi:MAG: amidohydrolase [Thermodesulfobacteriota bacterium]